MGRRFTANIPSQRITPPEVFFNRRKFLSALGLGALATPFARVRRRSLPGPARSHRCSRCRSAGRTCSRRSATRRSTRRRGAIGRQALTPRDVARLAQQLLRVPVRPRRGRFWQFCGDFEVEPWQIEVSGRVQQPADARPGRPVRLRPRGAGLSLPLRGALGHERALVRLPAEPADREGRPDEQRPLRPFRDRGQRGADAGRDRLAVVPVALPRGPAPRRGDERADPRGHRRVRRAAAPAARRAGAPHRALGSTATRARSPS